MRQVLVILLAYVFIGLCFGDPRNRVTGGPGLRIRLRIVDRSFIVKGCFVGTCVTLDHMKSFRVRVPALVEPCFIVEPGGINHQSVSLPMACRVSEERGIRVLLMT